MRTFFYFQKIKGYFFLSVALFLLFSLMGFFIGHLDPKASDDALSMLGELFELLLGLSQFQLFLFIFFNNAIKTLVAALMGLFFGIMPIIFILVNGFVLGIVTFQITDSHGWLFLIFGLLPHGALEIPAALFGAAIGLFLGAKSLRRVFNGNNFEVKKEIKDALVFLARVALPLILAAAFLEVFITPRLFNIIG